jgi:4-carboxymuconolactone decarboxylase
MRHLGDFIRFEGVLPARLKEILTLLVARHWTVDYMFAVHREMSAAAGLDPETVDAIAAGRRPGGLETAEAAAYDMARELLREGRVGDAAFAAARGALGERGVVELTAFIGYYTLLAMLLNMAETPPPMGATPLPQTLS